jgi:uncharacterized protein (DUF2267 family)/predicted transcriptional regulator
MSLRWYEWPRLVVLPSDASALEAARALENNQIGAVIVQDQGRVVGIVTDRDLALRVVGRELDARTTQLGEVMSPDVVTLPPEASQADAIGLMQARNVRRIPLVDGERIVGIVTLDDLLLDETVPVEELALVVRAQVGEGGPTAPQRAQSHAARRRGARAEATYGRFIHEVRTAAGLATAEQAETALEVVLTALLMRVTPDEAEDLIAQLPSLLHDPLRSLPPGPDRSITCAAIEDELVRRLDVDPERAMELLRAVAATLKRHVSAGQMEDVRGQLPEEMRNVFGAA